MFIREPLSLAGKRGAQILSALFWGRGNSSRDWCWGVSTDHRGPLEFPYARALGGGEVGEASGPAMWCRVPYRCACVYSCALVYGKDC